MIKQTPFHDLHLKAHAKMVDFAGWDMPLHYGSQLKEHHQVRQHVGMFDVSHMGIVDLRGEEVAQFLRYLLANNIDRLTVGKALYTCMLNEKGGVIDDLIVYQLSSDTYRLVINAGTRDKDLAWIRKKAATFKLEIVERTDLVMLAIQGPEVKAKLEELLSKDQFILVNALKPFHFVEINNWFVACTGYTGEEGVEIIFPATDASNVWQRLLALDILPCGLGARDTLRLEAGLNLYGADMNEEVTPLESNLAWTVMMEPKDRQFIGREALLKQSAEGIKHQLVGLVLAGNGVIRNHQKVIFNENSAENKTGEVTSGGYSPTLDLSIALARVPVETDKKCYVEIRNKLVAATVVKPPFVRFGKKMF